MHLENDHGTMLCENRKYCFLGKDLLPFAVALLDKYEQEEISEWVAMVKMLKNTVVMSLNTKEIDKGKISLQSLARLIEQLRVWVYCFKRQPDRVFSLGMSDIVFFELLE